MKHIRHGGRAVVYLAVLAALITGYLYWTLGRPLPLLQPVTNSPALSSTPAANELAWPGTGQAAIGLAGSSVLETYGNQTPAPTASVAKMITALCVLQQKPLKLNQQGPIITLTAADVALYQNYVAHDGSVVPVVAGEQITQYQMLQAMLLPSANNMADSLAGWAFGSLPNYSAFANAYLKQHGLHSTHVGSDASGFDPGTTSNASDLVRLGELAMQNPVLAQIVGQSTATDLPLVGTVKNVNFLLGSDNIIGIKTGNTDAAGGVFVSASRITVNGKPVTIITALVGQPSLFAAMKSSQTLIRSSHTNFKPNQLVTAGTTIDRYRLPWGGSVAAVADKDLTVTTWAGNLVTASAHTPPISAHARAGQTVGSITTTPSSLIAQRSVAIKLTAAPTLPSRWWRLTHPLR